MKGALYLQSFPAPSCSLTHELTRVGAMQNLVKLIGQGNVACEKDTRRKELTTKQHGQPEVAGLRHLLAVAQLHPRK